MNANVELKVVNVADLIPYATNANTHTDEQVAAIAASIKAFGFVAPVITDGSNGIIAGHGRVLAARKLGIESVRVIEASWLTPAQIKAYVLVDNKLAKNSEWDRDMLRVELGALQELDFDLSLTGFDEVELRGLFDDSTKPYEPVNKEIDPNALVGEGACKCPRCGFEFQS